VELTLILLDTNAYTAFKRNIFEAVEVIRNTTLIGLNSVILGELYDMVVLSWVLERNITEENLSNFWKYPKLTVLRTQSARYARSIPIPPSITLEFIIT
jgi:tRNA(fMet)-specific endonuclease VapC